MKGVATEFVIVYSLFFLNVFVIKISRFLIIKNIVCSIVQGLIIIW